MKLLNSPIRPAFFKLSLFSERLRRLVLWPALMLSLVLPMAVRSQTVYYITNSPERFGVIDVIPNNLSGETNQNSEPSLAVGTGYKNSGAFITHAFDMNSTQTDLPNNTYYTSLNRGTTWANAGQIVDGDFTLDWSPGGEVYAGYLSDPRSPSWTLFVGSSSGLPGVFFPIIASYTAMDNFPPDQPQIRVVEAKTGQDCIYTGFNDLGHWGGIVASNGTGKTASVLISTNSGASWKDTVLEKETPLGQDMPSLRVALSKDGTTNYVLFERLTSSNTPYIDYLADIVLTRDDNFAGTFTSLPVNGNGGNDGQHDTQVAINAHIPYPFTSLGVQRLDSSCDIAINPNNPREVYVAYNIVPNGIWWDPVIAVQHSTDAGVTFSQVYTTTNEAGLPALSVLPDGTLGMLFASIQGANLQVQFLKAPQGNFSNVSIRTLAIWPDNYPIHVGQPYIGDYFQLRSSGYNFYGVFSASNDPKPGHFPSGIYYQRNVRIAGSTFSDFLLNANQSGTLVDLFNNPVNVSIDPFFFYDIAANITTVFTGPYLILPYATPFDPIDPYNGQNHYTWPQLPASFPQLQLQSSTTLGNSANWTNQPGAINTNDESEFLPIMTQPQQFFRLVQNVAGGQFRTFASGAENGTLFPSGVLTNAGLTSQTYTATPSNNYGVATWYLDGVPVQSGGSTLTLTNIGTEHVLLATFAPTNDIAVSIAEQPLMPGPTMVNTPFNYEIDIANSGLGAVTGVTMTNILDPTVSFVSVTNTLDIDVTNSGDLIIANVGTLAAGASATIFITVVPNSENMITDTVSVACSQFEPDLSNNTATDISRVLTPATVITDPTNETVSTGGTATFTVGVEGTPPLSYQWLYNGVTLPGATNAILTLTNITAANAGSYEVGVYQNLDGPEGGTQAESDPATLTVNP